MFLTKGDNNTYDDAAYGLYGDSNLLHERYVVSRVVWNVSTFGYVFHWLRVVVLVVALVIAIGVVVVLCTE